VPFKWVHLQAVEAAVLAGPEIRFVQIVNRDFLILLLNTPDRLGEENLKKLPPLCGLPLNVSAFTVTFLF
jgi:hypothetical protein